MKQFLDNIESGLSVFSPARFNMNRVVLTLIIITVAAAALRFIQLDYAPSGGQGDVSWIGINALDWVDRGIVPFYVRELYSPEFFPVYFTGILLQVVGVSYLPQRIFTASMGVLFVVLLYPMTYWLIGEKQSRVYRQRAGLFAALAGALSLHVVGLNRLGMESPPFLTTLALFAALTAWAWQRDGEPGSLWRWALAGAALGLNQYVSLQARLLPILLVLWMLHALLAQRARFRASLRGWVVMAFVSFVITLPAILLFLYAPESFSGRADLGTASTGGWIWLYDTSRFGGVLPLLLKKFALNLQGIGISWVGAYGFMDLPILSPVFFLGFLIAVGLWFRNARQTAFTWSLLAIPVMLITDLISGASLEIHALHQMGIIPFVCVLSGLGLAWLWGIWDKTPARWLHGFGVGVRGVLIVGAFVPTILGMSHYLQVVVPSEYSDPQWGWRKAQTDVDLGRYMSAHSDQSFLLPYSEYTRPDVAWILAAGYRARRSAIDANGMLDVENPPATLTVIHMEDPERPRHDGYPARPDSRLWVLLHDNTVFLLPPLTVDQANAVMVKTDSEPLVDASHTVIAHFDTMSTPDGLFAARQVIDHPVDAVLDGKVRLLGYSVPVQELQPGLSMHVTLYWQVLEPLPFDYEVFAQIWTDDAQPIAKAHDYPFSGMYRSRIWKPNEVVATHHFLQIPDDVTPGRYTLVAGMFRYLLNKNVPTEGGNADPALRVVRAGTFRVPRTADTVEAPPIEPLSFGDQLQIVGLAITSDDTPLETAAIHPGSTLQITLTWEALQAMPLDYSLFVHLTNNVNAAPLAQVDRIIGESYPTSIWRAKERLTSQVSLQIPPDLQQGTYRLVIGVYDWHTGTRLPTIGGDLFYPLVNALEVMP